LIVEAAPGGSGLPASGVLPGPCTNPTPPDLQIETNRFLGTPTPLVCPPDPNVSTGIPAFPTPDFSSNPVVTTALQDFASRFEFVTSPSGACTLDSFGNFSYVNSGPNPNDPNIRQYCDLVTSKVGFQAGDTLLTLQVFDTAKNPGPPAQIIIRPTAPF